MYKKLFIATALLLAVVVLTASRSTFSGSPQLIKKVTIRGQTDPIPPTELFTPQRTGLFRVSAYMVNTGKRNLHDLSFLNLNWVDEAGGEQTYQGLSLPYFIDLPHRYGNNGGSVPGSVSIIEAEEGQPVTYEVTGTGEQYSLYLVVEQLAN